MPEQPGPETRRRRPTIRDVAELAGVSKSLVSLVLRDSPRVSDRSRAAVEDAIRQLGYRPSAMARSLVSGHSGLIGMITSKALDFFFFEVIEGISARLASGDGLVPLVLHGVGEPSSEQRAARQFLELGVEGLTLLGSTLPDDELERISEEVSLLIVGRSIESATIDVVASDDKRGGAMAARHLLDLGHRHVAHIGGGSGAGAAERESGFRSAFEVAGGDPVIVEGSYHLEGGREGARRLMDSPGRLPTAVFAANDLCAIGAIEEFRSAGHRVPDDISIIGYDDIVLAGLHGIDLTTINQPGRQMGQTAAAMLERRVATGRREAQQVLIEPALIVRSTTGPI